MYCVAQNVIRSTKSFLIQAREELLEKESTNSVKDAAMEKLVADVLDDETKSDELGFDIKSSEDEEKMEVIFSLIMLMVMN